MPENQLYYGDNLEVLRDYIEDESVDLVYLDPPFKSSQDYNVLFAEQNGSRSAAQIMAFEDTWETTIPVSLGHLLGRLTNTELQRFLDEAKRNTGAS